MSFWNFIGEFILFNWLFGKKKSKGVSGAVFDHNVDDRLTDVDFYDDLDRNLDDNLDDDFYDDLDV